MSLEHTLVEQHFELANLPSSSLPEQLPVTRSWHPRLTGYRIFVVVLTTGFGSAKAVVSYRGQSNASTTLEWVFTVVVFLGLYFLGLNEKGSPHMMPWLFETDYATYLWRILSLCSFPAPSYRSDERSTVMLIKKQHPPLTAYRLLVSVTATGFGLTKAILTYTGHSTSSTTIDWVSGVLLTIGLYWLGLYESNSVEMMPALFDTDYTALIQAFLTGSLRGGFVLGYLLLHAILACLAAGWTYVWFHGLVELWSNEVPDGGSGSDVPPPGPSTFDTISLWSFKLMWSAGACAAIGAGAVGCFVVIGHFVIVLLPYVRSFFTYLNHRFRPERSEVPDAEIGLLDWAASAIPQPPSTPLVHNIFKGLWLGLIILGYIIGHVVAMIICAGWTLLWLYGLVVIWKANFAGHGSNIFLTAFMWSFSLLWSAGACLATGVGLVGCFTVLVSLLTSWTGRRPSLPSLPFL